MASLVHISIKSKMFSDIHEFLSGILLWINQTIKSIRLNALLVELCVLLFRKSTFECLFTLQDRRLYYTMCTIAIFGVISDCPVCLKKKRKPKKMPVGLQILYSIYKTIQQNFSLWSKSSNCEMSTSIVNESVPTVRRRTARVGSLIDEPEQYESTDTHFSRKITCELP